MKWGIDSPIGGFTTNIPFGSNEDITVSKNLPSINIPVGGGANLKVSLDQTNYKTELSTPVGSLNLGIKQNLNDATLGVTSPTFNLSLGPTVNAFIKVSFDYEKFKEWLRKPKECK